MSRYLVTGAAGFIGSHLMEALLDGGHDVEGVDAFTSHYDRMLKLENAYVLPVEMYDLVEDSKLDVARYDGVFHLAGEPGVASFGDTFPAYVRNNILATQRILESAAEFGTRVVLASSSSVYGETLQLPTLENTEPRPRSPYGVTKLACEHLAWTYAKAYGVDVVTVRYFTTYGPRQRPDMAFAMMMAAALEGWPFKLYGRGNVRDFVYVEDAVDATIRLMEHGRSGVPYNVGGGHAVSMEEIIQRLNRITGKRLEVTREEQRPGDVTTTAADIDRVCAATGWEPTTTLDAGLTAQWEWTRERRRDEEEPDQSRGDVPGEGVR